MRPPPAAALPFVFVNMSMTADGKIATANRRLSTFTSRRDQEHLLELRAQADAVMCGARTADLNPITLGAGPAKYQRRRLQRGLTAHPLRILVSGSGTLHPGARVFQRRFSPIVILTTRRVPPNKLRRLQQVADEVRQCGEWEIDFRRALRWLRRKWGVQRLLCEGGGELNAALFRAGLVNELHLTVAPVILGGRQAPTFADGLGVEDLAQATRLTLKSSKRSGDELFLVYAVRRQTAT